MKTTFNIVRCQQHGNSAKLLPKVSLSLGTKAAVYENMFFLLVFCTCYCLRELFTWLLSCAFIIYTAGNSNSYISHVPAFVSSKTFTRLIFACAYSFQNEIPTSKKSPRTTQKVLKDALRIKGAKIRDLNTMGPRLICILTVHVVLRLM